MKRRQLNKDDVHDEEARDHKPDSATPSKPTPRKFEQIKSTASITQLKSGQHSKASGIDSSQQSVPKIEKVPQASGNDNRSHEGLRVRTKMIERTKDKL